MKRTYSLDERMEKKREQIRRLKLILIITSIVSFLLIFPSFLGGPGGAVCYLLLIFGPFIFPFLVVFLLLYFQMKNTVKGYDRMWEEFKARTFDQGLEPLKEGTPKFKELLDRCSRRDCFTRYPVFGTRQDIWGREVWTWLWRSEGSSDNKNERAAVEYLVAMTFIQNFKGWITLRKENILDLGILVKDIQFEDPDFNDEFYVMASSKKVAYDLFHPRMMEFWKRKGNFGMEIRDGWLMLFRSVSKSDIFGESFIGFHYDVSPLLEFQIAAVEFMEEFIDMIPGYVKGNERFEAIEMKNGYRADMEHDEILEL